MTIEEAIKILDPETSRETLLRYEDNEECVEAVNEACLVACAALRAQQAPARLDRIRWKGCEYCNDPQPYKDCVLPDGTERFLCALDDQPLPSCYINTRHVEFCPHCGRPLTEEAWAELERRIEGNDGEI